MAAAGTLGLSLNVSRMVTKQAGAFYLVLKGGNGGLGKLLARRGEQMCGGDHSGGWGARGGHKYHRRH